MGSRFSKGMGRNWGMATQRQSTAPPPPPPPPPPPDGPTIGDELWDPDSVALKKGMTAGSGNYTSSGTSGASASCASLENLIPATYRFTALDSQGFEVIIHILIGGQEFTIPPSDPDTLMWDSGDLVVTAITDQGLAVVDDGGFAGLRIQDPSFKRTA